jgi:hypothetical protein
MFLVQALEDGKSLKFPTSETAERKHYRSLSEYYENMGVS